MFVHFLVLPLSCSRPPVDFLRGLTRVIRIRVPKPTSAAQLQAVLRTTAGMEPDEDLGLYRAAWAGSVLRLLADGWGFPSPLPATAGATAPWDASPAWSIGPVDANSPAMTTSASASALASSSSAEYATSLEGATHLDTLPPQQGLKGMPRRSPAEVRAAWRTFVRRQDRARAFPVSARGAEPTVRMRVGGSSARSQPADRAEQERRPL